MSQRAAAALLIVTAGLGLAALRAAGQSDDETKLLQSNSDAPYVHRITLYDHDGEAIDPEDEFAGPYSPRMTCSKCHPYAQISCGWHFNAPNRGVSAGRPGEPWLLVDEETGTVLPISGRGWPGTFTLQEVGLTNWDFVLRFGHHLPGGGFGEPNSEPRSVREWNSEPRSVSERNVAARAPRGRTDLASGRRPGQSEPRSVRERTKPRWNISGHLEIDCMFCHAADQQHDPAEAARQIEKENFKWAPTVALGLAVVRGEARKAPDDWDPMLPPDPDFPEKAGPRLVWDKSRFDADNRVLFNMTRRPSAERCYFCHSFRQVGSQANQGIAAPQDVHMAAGLTCVDCHRNGLDHMMVRGYRTEAQERGQPEIAVFTCEGCHLGVGGGPGTEAVLGGRYGAPHPQHRGLPPLHFEKLTCTACHSGPWPELSAKRFQTALAHGLGLATRERTDSDPPHIIGPVFARQHDGKIAPQWMVWPAFWTTFHLGSFTPIPLVDVRKAMQQAAPARLNKDVPQPDLLTPEELAEVLRVLLRKSRDSRTAPLYLRNGSVYALTPEGKLGTGAYPGVGPKSDPSIGAYRWSIAHNVRPAAQSLGVGGCTDCHADGAPIYFGRIIDADDTQADERPIRYMHELRGDDPTFVRVWNFGFVFRPAFEWFGFICAGVVGLVLLHYALAAVGAITRRFR